MDILRLNIRSESIKMELNIKDPMLRFETTKPVLDIQTEAASYDVKRTNAKLEMDFTPWRYSIGIKNSQTLSRENAQMASQFAQAGTSRRVQEGNTMSALENKQDPVGQLAWEAMFTDQVSINVGQIAAPDVQFVPGELKFYPTVGKVKYHLNRGELKFNLERGTVSPQITRYSSLRMWTSVNKFDIYS